MNRGLPNRILYRARHQRPAAWVNVHYATDRSLGTRSLLRLPLLRVHPHPSKLEAVDSLERFDRTLLNVARHNALAV